MATPLPPTVVGPVLDGALVVRVEHTRTTDMVALFIDGPAGEVIATVAAAEQTTIVETSGLGLAVGATLRVASEPHPTRGDAGAPVLVGPAPAVLVAPWFPSLHVRGGAQRVRVHGAVPGHWAVVSHDGVEIGRTPAAPDGAACVAIPPSLPDRAQLTAHVEVGVRRGPTSTRVVVLADNDPPSTPVWVDPQPCVAYVAFTGLTVGALLRIRSASGEELLRAPICAPLQGFVLPRTLLRGEALVADSALSGDFLSRVSAQAFASVAGAAPAGAGGIREAVRHLVPEPVVGPVLPGATAIDVSGLVRGAEVWLSELAEGFGEPLTELGRLGLRAGAHDLGIVERTERRPVGASGVLTLPAALRPGTWWAVTQALCEGRASALFRVPEEGVREPPPPPVIHAPLWACSQAVRVTGVTPGARVDVLVDGVLAGSAPAPAATVWVGVAPALREGQVVEAVQVVPWDSSPPSAPVVVTARIRLSPPRVLGPVADGDETIWVSRVTPGCRLEVWHRDGAAHALLGVTDRTAEPVLRVPLDVAVPAGGEVFARANQCHEQRTGPALGVVKYPGDPGDVSWRTWDACLEDADVSGEAHDIPVRIWAPADPADTRAVVFVQHGLGNGRNAIDSGEFGWFEYVDRCTGRLGGPNERSHLGYAWFAETLASQGIAVASFSASRTHDPEEREAWLIGGVRALTAIPGPDLPAELAALPCALVGHSVGGRAVELAAGTLAPGFDVRAVLAFAPATHQYDRAAVAVPYLQVFGLRDFFVDAHVRRIEDHLRGVPGFDRVSARRTLVTVPGSGHSVFNEEWFYGIGGFGGTASDYVAYPSVEAVWRGVRPLVVAFLREHLLGEAELHGYQEGLVRPRDAEILDLRILHDGGPGTVVVDSFGNDFPAIGHVSEAGDVGVNDLGGANTFIGFDAEFFGEHAVEPLEQDPDDVGDPGAALLHDEGVRFLSLPTSRLAIATFALPTVAIPETGAIHIAVASGAHQSPGPRLDVDRGLLPPAGTPHPFIVRVRDAAERVVEVDAEVVRGVSRETFYPRQSEGEDDSEDVPVVAFHSVRVPADALLALDPELDLDAWVEVELVLEGPSYVLVRQVEVVP